MKYNAIENAEQFIKDQVEWVKANGYKDFTIWSNGKELVAKLDSNDIASTFQNVDLKNAGYWKAMQFVNGYRVEF